MLSKFSRTVLEAAADDDMILDDVTSFVHSILMFFFSSYLFIHLLHQEHLFLSVFFCLFFFSDRTGY